MPRDIVFSNQCPLEHTKVPSLEPKYCAVESQNPEVIQTTLTKVIKSHLLRLINDLKRLPEEWNSCARFRFRCVCLIKNKNGEHRKVYSAIYINNRMHIALLAIDYPYQMTALREILRHDE